MRNLSFSLRHQNTRMRPVVHLYTVLLVSQVPELETDPLFNSGHGSALTENGTMETEASIMDGPGRR
ncbi:hypothetical protein L1887_01938 [Cichorium endivia]|nr:hypothetical protein L1887_01938 [Cichorium endivia]